MQQHFMTIVLTFSEDKLLLFKYCNEAKRFSLDFVKLKAYCSESQTELHPYFLRKKVMSNHKAT